MRDFKGMKRQRGRNRNSGGKPQQHNANRAYDSNGPEGIKVRGAAQSVFEKYQQLARDATTSGDRVLAENYLQHAEHYFRLIRAIQPTRSVSDIVGRDNYSSGMDIDFEAEHEEPTENAASDNDAGSQQGEGGDGDERPRFDNNRQNRDRDRDRDQNRDDRQRFDNNRQNRDQNRDDRGQSDQGGRRDRWRDRDDRARDQQHGRDDRQRDDSAREDRSRDERPRDERPRDERPRDDGARDDRPREGRRGRFERNRDRDDRGEARDPLAVIEPQAAPLAPEPKPESSPRLRGQDGAVSELPGFLSRSAPAAEETADAAPAKPKRRRAPKSFEGAEAAKDAGEG